MTRDLFRLALRNIRHRGLRSWLTVIGILIGTAAVVALISIGQGLERAITQQVEGIFGYNTLFITSGANFSQRFRLDVEGLREIPGVEAAVTVRTETAYVEGPAGKGFLSVLGYDPQMDAFTAELGLSLASGRALTSPGEVLLGSRVARSLGVAVGDSVLIEDKPFTVVGVLGAQERQQGGGAPGGLALNDTLVVFLADLRSLFPGPELVQYAIVRVKEGASIAAVKEEVQAHLRTVGGNSARIVDFADLTEGIRSMLSGVQAFLAGIAGISLLVGGVGVMNTMYTAVLERTKEIGVLKAVGAKDSHVLLLFLFESGLMGLGGGILGLVLGFGTAWIAVSIAVRVFNVQGAFSPVLGIGMVFGILLFSFLVGALAGVFPARRASHLPPVEALRYE